MPRGELRTEGILIAPVTTAGVLVATARPGRATLVLQCDFVTGVACRLSWTYSANQLRGSVDLQPGEIAVFNGRDDEGKINGDLPWFGDVRGAGIGASAAVRGNDSWWINL